jgi:hypothetical protein
MITNPNQFTSRHATPDRHFGLTGALKTHPIALAHNKNVSTEQHMTAIKSDKPFKSYLASLHHFSLHPDVIHHMIDSNTSLDDIAKRKDLTPEHYTKLIDKGARIPHDAPLNSDHMSSLTTVKNPPANYGDYHSLQSKHVDDLMKKDNPLLNTRLASNMNIKLEPHQIEHLIAHGNSYTRRALSRRSDLTPEQKEQLK